MLRCVLTARSSVFHLCVLLFSCLCVILSLFFFRLIFNDLKGGMTRSHKGLFHLLIHSLNGCSVWSQEPPLSFPHESPKALGYLLLPSQATIGELDRKWSSEMWTSAHKVSQHLEEMISSSSHDAGLYFAEHIYIYVFVYIILKDFLEATFFEAILLICYLWLFKCSL